MSKSRFLNPLILCFHTRFSNVQPSITAILPAGIVICRFNFNIPIRRYEIGRKHSTVFDKKEHSNHFFA